MSERGLFRLTSSRTGGTLKVSEGLEMEAFGLSFGVKFIPWKGPIVQPGGVQWSEITWVSPGTRHVLELPRDIIGDVMLSIYDSNGGHLIDIKLRARGELNRRHTWAVSECEYDSKYSFYITYENNTRCISYW